MKMNPIIPIAIGAGLILFKKKPKKSKKVNQDATADTRSYSSTADIKEEAREIKKEYKRPVIAAAPAAAADALIDIERCISSLYSPSEKLSENILKNISEINKDKLPKLLSLNNDKINISKSFQDLLYLKFFDRYMKMKSGREMPLPPSIVIREELSKLLPDCNWDEDISTKNEEHKNIWVSALIISSVARLVANYLQDDKNKLFKTGKRYTIPREYLNLSESAIASEDIELDQIIAFIATDFNLDNIEIVYGRVSKLSGPNGESDKFELRVIDEFNGNNVEPKLSNRHKFKYKKDNQSSNAFFSRIPPTGIYQIYPKGMK